MEVEGLRLGLLGLLGRGLLLGTGARRAVCAA